MLRGCRRGARESRAGGPWAVGPGAAPGSYIEMAWRSLRWGWEWGATEEGTESPGGSAPVPNPPRPPPPIPPLIPPPCQWPPPPPPPPPPGPPTPWPAAPPACWPPRSALFSVCILVIYRRGGGGGAGRDERMEGGTMGGEVKGEGGGESTEWSKTSIHSHRYSKKGLKQTHTF